MRGDVIVEKVAVAYIDGRGGSSPYFAPGSVECLRFTVTIQPTFTGKGYELISIDPPLGSRFPQRDKLYTRILQILASKYDGPIRRQSSSNSHSEKLRANYDATSRIRRNDVATPVLTYTQPCPHCGGFPFVDKEMKEVRCLHCGRTLYPEPMKAA